MSKKDISLSIKQLLIDILSLDLSVEDISDDMLLLGNIPEFDSMAIVSVLTAIEEEFDVTIEDDDLSAEVFESIESLAGFVVSKQM